MALTSGTKLGPYEIQSPLGAGGMGEVYRARDTRLEREVAIKVLPAHLSAEPGINQRLEREAKAVSKLSHPHICALHDIGHQDGVDFLVMELVEGDTLEQRLRKGPLPPDEVIRYAAQIADALAKAHKHGFVHRDLKPSNIMLTKSGSKLMDFGLAKQTAPATLTDLTVEQSKLTGEGMIVGTFQYMAPEQLEGKETDARTDIFALGEVIYEMATAKPAFNGKTRASLIAAILASEPQPMTILQPVTPPSLERIVKRCLAKDPEDRWQSAKDLADELTWIAEGGSQGTPFGLAKGPKRREAAWAILAALLFLAVVTLVFALLHPWHSSSPGMTLRFQLLPPGKEILESGMALSPNGQQLVFVTRSEGGTQLWLRPLNAVDAHPLSGTQNAWQPFWSPDGHYLAFFADRKLKKIDLASGTVQTLSDAPDPRGGAWSTTGVIVFAPKFNTPLYQIPAEGGEPSPVTKLDQNEIGHRWPYFLPDGRHFIFFRYYQQLVRKPVWVGTLDSKEQKQILESESMVQYAPPGYLIYVREHALVAQRFNASRLKLEGHVIPVAEGVEAEGENGEATGRSPFTTSEAGILAYSSGQVLRTLLTWYDRKGTVLGAIGPPGDLTEPSISPDGRFVAVSRANPGEARNVWIYDLVRDTQSRMTFDPRVDNGTPVWTPDGNHIIFSSLRRGYYDLEWKLSNGATSEELLYRSDGNKSPDDVSREGRYLIFEQDNWRRGHFELWVLPLAGERKARSYLLSTDSDVIHATFSPDTRWVAYVSNAPGRTPEVFVQSFPEPTAKFQISNGGGDSPIWRADGKELFYVTPDQRIMAVAVEEGPGFHADVPRSLFQIRLMRAATRFNYRTAFSISSDGKRILVNKAQEESVQVPITVAVNWATELK